MKSFISWEERAKREALLKGLVAKLKHFRGEAIEATSLKLSSEEETLIAPYLEEGKLTLYSLERFLRREASLSSPHEGGAPTKEIDTPYETPPAHVREGGPYGYATHTKLYKPVK